MTSEISTPSTSLSRDSPCPPREPALRSGRMAFCWPSTAHRDFGHEKHAAQTRCIRSSSLRASFEALSESPVRSDVVALPDHGGVLRAQAQRLGATMRFRSSSASGL